MLLKTNMDHTKIKFTAGPWCKELLIFFNGFYVAQTQYRSYGLFSSFTGEGRPQVCLCALFQTQTGI
jgi:hypothetical protein